MLLRYIVSPVTVQEYASDYKALSLEWPINYLWSPFLFIFVSLVFWNHFPHHLIIIYTQSAVTLLQSGHCSPGLTSLLSSGIVFPIVSLLSMLNLLLLYFNLVITRLD